MAPSWQLAIVTGRTLPRTLQDLARLLDGVGVGAGDVAQDGQEEVAEAVAVQALAAVEAVLEERAEEPGVAAQGGQAAADVAGRQEAEFVAQAAGAAARVHHGHDGGQVDVVFFEAQQDVVGARAAADDDDPGAAMFGRADIRRFPAHSDLDLPSLR